MILPRFSCLIILFLLSDMIASEEVVWAACNVDKDCVMAESCIGYTAINAALVEDYLDHFRPIWSVARCSYNCPGGRANFDDANKVAFKKSIVCKKGRCSADHSIFCQSE